MLRMIFVVATVLMLVLPMSLVSAHEGEPPCTGVLILDGFARPTVTQTGAAYGTIVNLGEEDITLVGGSIAIAEAVEIHEMMMDGETMVMNPLPDGLVIPAGEAVRLEPGGYHVMFINVTSEVAEDTMLDFELQFAEMEDAIALSFPVMQPPDMGEMDHEMMATEEPMGHGGDDHAHPEHEMMASSVIGLGDCAEVDFEGATSGIMANEDGTWSLMLAHGEDHEWMFPFTSIKTNMMNMMEATPSSN